jgi:hypothetical protein
MAGSGGSAFRDVRADLLFTGELSHHEALAATERGAAVVALFHSNTERGFLKAVMKGRLEKVLGEEWARVRKAERNRNRNKKNGADGKEDEEDGEQMEDMGEEWDESWEEALADESVEVEVSERDRDPYGIVILQDTEQVGTVLSGGGGGGGGGEASAKQQQGNKGAKEK